MFRKIHKLSLKIAITLAFVGTVLAETVAAWLRVDAESGAQELRSRIESSGLPAAREHELLLQVEGTLEELTRAVLAGHGVDAAGALGGVRSQLG